MSVMISESEKIRLKNIPVERVAEALGLDVTRHHCLCFGHDDHHPSLVFNVRNNTWKCYACGIYGDSISLVQQKQGVGFVDACSWLGARFGIMINNDEGAVPVVVPKAAAQSRPAAKEKDEAAAPDVEVQKRGCTRVQNSIFIADLPVKVYEQIQQDLKEVQGCYDNHDSILVVPVPAEHLRSMCIIGRDIDLDTIMKAKSTLFF